MEEPKYEVTVNEYETQQNIIIEDEQIQPQTNEMNQIPNTIQPQQNPTQIPNQQNVPYYPPYAQYGQPYPQTNEISNELQPQFVQPVGYTVEMQQNIYNQQMNRMNQYPTYPLPQYNPQYNQSYVPQSPSQPNQESPEKQSDETSDSPLSFILLICGFCCTLLWILNYLLFRKSAYANERKHAKWSLAAFLILFLCDCLLFLFLIFASGSSDGNTNY